MSILAILHNVMSHLCKYPKLLKELYANVMPINKNKMRMTSVYFEFERFASNIVFKLIR